MNSEYIYEYSLQRSNKMSINEDTLGYKIGSNSDAVKVLSNIGLHEQEQEHFVVLFLNTKNIVVGYQTVTTGLVDRSLVHAREVFRLAILSGCSRIIVAHNHPTGDINPSSQDIATTEKILGAGEILGIQVLDHIIIGEDLRGRVQSLSLRESHSWIFNK